MMWSGSLFCLAGVLFEVAALVDHNRTYIPIGMLFVVLGLSMSTLSRR